MCRENRLGLGAALAEDLVANLVILRGCRGDLVLRDLVLERSEIVHDLDNPHGASFINYPGLSVEWTRRPSCGNRRCMLTTVCHHFDLALGVSSGHWKMFGMRLGYFRSQWSSSDLLRKSGCMCRERDSLKLKSKTVNDLQCGWLIEHRAPMASSEQDFDEKEVIES